VTAVGIHQRSVGMISGMYVTVLLVVCIGAAQVRACGIHQQLSVRASFTPYGWSLPCARYIEIC